MSANDQPSIEGIEAELRAQLAGGNLELPPIPDLAQRVLSLTSDPSADASALAAVIHRDPALAASVLRGANGAALCGVTPVVTLQQAVARLGLKRVSEIAIAASLRAGIFANALHAALVTESWRRSLATALYAKEIMRTLRGSVETGFLAGLLVDIGTPLTLHALTGHEAPESKLSDADARALCERLGAEFGESAAEAWGLPLPVRHAIAEQGAEQPESDEGATVHLAARLAALVLAGEEEKAEPLSSEPSAAKLGLYPDDLEALLAKADDIRAELEATP